jgi:hypothetical protein
VAVNTYGNSPIVLLIIISKNSAENVIFIPLFLIMIFISLNRDSATSGMVFLCREGTSQTLLGRMKKTRAVLNQFRWSDMIDDDGSKMENRFIIIFRFFDLGGAWQTGLQRIIVKFRIGRLRL